MVLSHPFLGPNLRDEGIPRQRSHPLLGTDLGVIVEHPRLLLLLLLVACVFSLGLGCRLDARLRHADQVVNVVARSWLRAVPGTALCRPLWKTRGGGEAAG